MLLLDLDNCDVGYSPTTWQRDRLPREFRDKVRVIFDGVDTDLWKPRVDAARVVKDVPVADDMKIITYVARGMESIRGFDVFMKMAKILGDRRKDVLFVVVGQDKVCYGGDERYLGGKTFKQWVLSNDDYDLSRFVFTGLLPTPDLARLFAITDVHVYLTVPFVLSWSLMNALACGATVIASDTGPVREMIVHGENGLLADFFDAEAMANLASEVLDNSGGLPTSGPRGHLQDRRKIQPGSLLAADSRALPRSLVTYFRPDSSQIELIGHTSRVRIVAEPPLANASTSM